MRGTRLTLQNYLTRPSGYHTNTLNQLRLKSQFAKIPRMSSTNLLETGVLAFNGSFAVQFLKKCIITNSHCSFSLTRNAGMRWTMVTTLKSFQFGIIRRGGLDVLCHAWTVTVESIRRECIDFYTSTLTFNLCSWISNQTASRTNKKRNHVSWSKGISASHWVGRLSASIWSSKQTRCVLNRCGSFVAYVGKTISSKGCLTDLQNTETGKLTWAEAQ